MCGDAAMRILDDPDREFAASTFLRLEVIPQAAFNRRTAEPALYEAFFAAKAGPKSGIDDGFDAALGPGTRGPAKYRCGSGVLSRRTANRGARQHVPAKGGLFIGLMFFSPGMEVQKECQ